MEHRRSPSRIATPAEPSRSVTLGVHVRPYQLDNHGWEVATTEPDGHPRPLSGPHPTSSMVYGRENNPILRTPDLEEGLRWISGNEDGCVFRTRQRWPRRRGNGTSLKGPSG